MTIPADYFSHQTGICTATYPLYPEELFDYLVGLSTTTHRAFVYQVGNNQAASSLASRFDTVISADLNHRQIKNTGFANNIDYICSTAEKIPLAENSMDLITVAQAWHWLEADILETEANRVLRPGGLLAIWGFNLLRVNDPISYLIKRFYYEELKDYWPDERKKLEQAYIDFPCQLALMPTPAFTAHQAWSITRLLEYIFSWETTQKLITAGKKAIYDDFCYDMTRQLGDTKKLLSISWPLTLRVARKKH